MPATLTSCQQLLRFEPSPISAPFSNLRSSLPPQVWRRIERDVLAAQSACECCGADHRCELHEDWVYDDEAQTQTLDRFVVLCADCHEVKHFACAMRAGRGRACFERMCAMMEFPAVTGYRYVAEALEVWQARNEVDWQPNVRHLAGFSPCPRPLPQTALADMGRETETSALLWLMGKRLPLLMAVEPKKFIPAHKDLH